MRTIASTTAITSLLMLMAALDAVAQALPYQTSEPGMTPMRRELYFYGMRSYPFGRIPQSARQEAILRASTRLPAFAAPSGRTLMSANRWLPIGPHEIGGRVNSIVCHPTDGKTLWIGAADGGVWKSTDRGGFWQPLMDNENAIAMGALAVDPKNTDVLYAGTGEMSSNSDSYTGAGIMKTVDGGATWRPVALTNVGAFSKIVVSPTNSLVVYAGATKNNGGLYRSTDGGNTWSRTFAHAVSDVSINPANTSQLWIGTMSKGVYRSDDGGRTWTQKNNGLLMYGDVFGRISVQCAPSLPSTLYALHHESNSNGDTSYARIYVSTNSGDSWDTSYTGGNFLDHLNGTQGWYNNVIAVHPVYPYLAYAGGIGAVTTSNVAAPDVWRFIGGLHADQHAIAIDPTNPDRIYFGNDGGVYFSEDGGTVFRRRNNGLAIAQFYAMKIDDSDPLLTYGGTQDNGTVANNSSQTGDFLGGDGFFVCVNPLDRTIIFAETQYGFLYRVNTTAHEEFGIMEGILGDDEAAWSAPLVMDPRDPQVMWHGRHHLYVTTDQGNIWRPTDVRFEGQASAIGISPANTAIVYGGSDHGEIFVTTNGGPDWADRTNAPGAPNRAITDFAPSAKDANTCFMTVSGFFSGHVFKTTDRGASWADISGELPDIPINAIALHPDDEKIIYIGSDIGMFISTDGGASWANYNEGLPRVAVADLEVHRTERKLRMASHGRSMWEIPLEKPVLPPSILSPNGGEIWMAGTQHTISWSGISGAVRIEYSLDDGATWNPLIDNVTAYRWNVFDTAVIAARVRVTSMADAGRTATSRSFTITRFEPGGVTAARNVAGVIYGLVFDGATLWCSDFRSNNLLKLDPNTLALVGTVRLDSTCGDSLFTDMAIDPTTHHLLLHRLNGSDANPGGILLEIDTNGHELRRWESPCGYPTGLVYVRTPSGPRLIASDRSGVQNIYTLDAANPATIISTAPRKRRLQWGPRSAANGPDGNSVYQVITDFAGDGLQHAEAERMSVDDQGLICSFPLASQITSGVMNARGVEFDPRDSSLWITDYSGNIFKVVGCETRMPAGVDRAPGVPTEPATAHLGANAPNPFTTETNIPFMLTRAGSVRIALYGIDGRQRALVVDGNFEPGEHGIRFEPTGLASGIYRCVLSFDDRVVDQRMVVYVK